MVWKLQQVLRNSHRSDSEWRHHVAEIDRHRPEADAFEHTRPPTAQQDGHFSGDRYSQWPKHAPALQSLSPISCCIYARAPTALNLFLISKIYKCTDMRYRSERTLPDAWSCSCVASANGPQSSSFRYLLDTVNASVSANLTTTSICSHVVFWIASAIFMRCCCPLTVAACHCGANCFHGASHQHATTIPLLCPLIFDIPLNSITKYCINLYRGDSSKRPVHKTVTQLTTPASVHVVSRLCKRLSRIHLVNTAPQRSRV